MNDLASIAIVLLIGTLFSVFAYKLKVSNVFFLILAGMAIGLISIFKFTNAMIITLAEITLIMVVFDATSKLNFKEVLKFSKDSLKLTSIYFILTVIIMAGFFFYAFPLNPNVIISITISLLFAILIYGVDPAVALSVLKGRKEKIVEILEIESIINTPITVVFSFILISIIATNGASINVSEHFISLMQQIFVAIGIGIFTGFLIVRLLKKNFYGELSHITVITSAIITYVLAEAMNGNGVLAVSIFGLIFGNYRIQHKKDLEKFASIFTSTLNILVFILLGVVITIYSSSRTSYELWVGTALFFIYILIRFTSVVLTFEDNISFRKKLFMSINVPKGVDVAVIILLVITLISNIEGIKTLQNVALLFVLYSIVLTTISSVFTEYFFEDKEENKKGNKKKDKIENKNKVKTTKKISSKNKKSKK